MTLHMFLFMDVLSHVGRLIVMHLIPMDNWTSHYRQFTWLFEQLGGKLGDDQQWMGWVDSSYLRFI